MEAQEVMETNVEFKNDLKPDIALAVEAFLEKDFVVGEIISHDFIHEILGLPMPQPTMLYENAKTLELAILDARTNLFHRLLLDHNIAIRSIHGEGYTRVSPSKQVDWSFEVWRVRITRENAKARRRIKHINTHLFTASDFRKQSDALSKVGALASLVRKPRNRDW